MTMEFRKEFFANERDDNLNEIGKPTHRQILHHPYRIVYRADAKQVVVLTIRHSRRDWDAGEIVPGV